MHLASSEDIEEGESTGVGAEGKGGEGDGEGFDRRVLLKEGDDGRFARTHGRRGSWVTSIAAGVYFK